MRAIHVVVLVGVLLAVAFAGPLADRAANMRAHLNQAQSTWRRMQTMQRAMGLADLSVECALCGIAVNEVEGLVMENATEAEIEQVIKADVCDKLSATAAFICDEGVQFIPMAIERLMSKYTVSAVCIDLGMCENKFPTHADMVDVPSYDIDLDAEPATRFAEVCAVPAYQQTINFLINTVDSILPDGGKEIQDLGTLLNEMYLPTEYAAEIAGCAQTMGISPGWMTLFNLGYELSDACTSIVAEGEDGTIYHGRNLDFWAGMGFTDSLKDMTFIANYKSNNRTVFYSTTFPGYSGCLSCQKPFAFSATVDTRFHPKGLGDFFYEIVAAIEERNASLTTFLVREAIQNEASYTDAIAALSTGELIDDVYYIVAGTKSGEGAVISRNRTASVDTWTLSAPSRWFEVETNYDHWEPAPWFDDRRVPANNRMNAMGRSGLSSDAVVQVLSGKPTLNLQTTYTIMSVPKTGQWSSWTRWCPFPCTQ